MHFYLPLFFALLSTSPAFARPEANITLANVPAKVSRFDLKIRDAGLMKELKKAGGNFGYDMKFGRISPAQFDQLKVYFKKSEHLAYQAGASYTLLDFLPGKMQALLNQRHISTSRAAPELDDINLFYKNYGEVFTTINCWGTSWEMVRDSSIGSSLNLFLASRAHVFAELRSRGQVVSAKDATFGDMILFFTRENGEEKLQHTAISLGYGYYFERTDSGSAMFFRVAHLDDMLGRLKFFNGTRDDSGKPIKVGFELRRFSSGLPNPADIFSAANTANVGDKEYADALPDSENKDTVTLFSDDRLGGGDETVLMDIGTLEFRLNPTTGRGEVDPTTPSAEKVVGAD